MTIFDNKGVDLLAVDNDSAGQKGQAELIRRFETDKCKIVNFNDCKTQTNIFKAR
jgi:hypothetical protein